QNQNPAPPQIVPSPPSTSSPNSMVLAKPQPFNGTCGAAAEKVAFAVSFMMDYAATWSKPYLMNVFKMEEVTFNKFLDDFKSIFFYHNCQHRAEVALQSLCQTGTVLAYTQEFNSRACT
ncbi:uncharacterized protein VP01_13981g1, partial [Puccinia sorghi]